MGYLLRNGMLQAGWEDDGPLQAPAGMGYLLRNGMLKRGWEKEGPVQAMAGMGYLLRTSIEVLRQPTSAHADRHYKKACRDPVTGAPVACDDEDSASNASSTNETGSDDSCPSDIQTLIDAENDLGSTITDGTRIKQVPDCTRLGLPENADDQTCFGVEGSRWNHRSESECLPPLLNRKTSTKACNYSSDEMDVITRWTVFGGCHDTMESLLRKAWCLLLENLDIVDWVLCMVYGPDAGSCLQDIIVGARDVGLECATNISPTAQAFWGTGTVTFNPQHENLVGMKAMFESGDDEDRLCAVIRASALLFHELQHVCMLGGIYNSDWQKSWFEDRCEPTWLTYSTYTYAMYLRYPRARRSRCCVETLTALAWSSVPGDFVWESGCEK